MAHKALSSGRLKSLFRYLSAASLLTAAASACQSAVDIRTARDILGETFADFLRRLENESRVEAKRSLVDSLIERVSTKGGPLIEDSTVHFLFRGPARRVSVPSDLNGWNPAADTMHRMAGTDLFVLSKDVASASRFEYKLNVDSSWILDPLNPLQSFGGYGPNSELRMPLYTPPAEILSRPGVARGRIDTLEFKSTLLGRTHPVFVYLPAGYKQTTKNIPSLWVTDGGEYLSLALMHTILDNLIEDGRIGPLISVFIDPRTDIRNSETSKRMVDYALSETLTRALIEELRPLLLRKYRISTSPEETGIMGASMGGLCAVFTAFSRPDVFGFAAAQSPAFWWKDGAILRMIRNSGKKPVRFFVETGTIRDAETESRKMKEILLAKGYPLCYAEHPEAHNWAHWRAYIDDILTCFRKK
jgi:enterochelin esterase family protein